MFNSHFQFENGSFFVVFSGSNDIGPPPGHSVLAVGQLRPAFSSRIRNITVNVGREAVLACHVNNLGRYKVTNQHSRIRVHLDYVTQPCVIGHLTI